ncbi:hypothetical protein F4776DRAFT_643337 [Hypoxylon sp. NC0597]|nr:hypothetical protein F4776DRAFT_643337 [Hypoxylon sp. NC0597]
MLSSVCRRRRVVVGVSSFLHLCSRLVAEKLHCCEGLVVVTLAQLFGTFPVDQDTLFLLLKIIRYLVLYALLGRAQHWSMVVHVACPRCPG